MKALRYYDADSQFLIFLVSVVFRNGSCAFFRLQCFVNDVLKFTITPSLLGAVHTVLLQFYAADILIQFLILMLDLLCPRYS
jgi:hypothetical protein